MNPLIRPDAALDPNRRALRQWARAHGYPELPLNPAEKVMAGEEHWGLFISNGSDSQIASACLMVDVEVDLGSE